MKCKHMNSYGECVTRHCPCDPGCDACEALIRQYYSDKRGEARERGLEAIKRTIDLINELMKVDLEAVREEKERRKANVACSATNNAKPL